MFIPTGEVYLIKGVHFSNNYKHTRLHNNLTEQLNYFNKFNVLALTEFTTVRANQSLKVGYSLDSLRGYNYCYYRNDKTNKTIFCFITDKYYVSDEVTELLLETDVIQTFMFDYEMKRSYVTRCHVKRWENGLPTKELVNEGFDVNGHVISKKSKVANMSLNFIMTSTTPLGVTKGGTGGGDGDGTGSYINGVGGNWLIPTTGSVSATWHSYFNEELNYWHDGIDIATPNGTTVYASKSGTVTNIGYSVNSWGNFIDIDHGDGYMTRYAHLQNTQQVTVGQVVGRGEKIASSGNSGNSTGPHLHWGVYYGGTPIEMDSQKLLPIGKQINQGMGEVT